MLESFSISALGLLMQLFITTGIVHFLHSLQVLYFIRVSKLGVTHFPQSQIVRFVHSSLIKFIISMYVLFFTNGTEGLRFLEVFWGEFLGVWGSWRRWVNKEDWNLGTDEGDICVNNFCSSIDPHVLFWRSSRFFTAFAIPGCSLLSHSL